MVRFGKDTLVRYVGGQMIARQGGADVATLIEDYTGIARRSQDMSRPFSDFIKVWFRSERQVFRQQGIPRWRPLMPGYRAWKRGAYPGKTILRRTDMLWRSVTTRTRYTHIEVAPRSLQLGSNLPRSAMHQVGSDKINLPARPHVVLMPDAWAELNRLTLEHVLNGGKTRRRR